MKQRKSGIAIVMGMVLVTVMVYAVLSLAKMNARIEAAEAARDALAAEAQALTEGNASL